MTDLYYLLTFVCPSCKTKYSTTTTILQEDNARFLKNGTAIRVWCDCETEMQLSGPPQLKEEDK